MLALGGDRRRLWHYQWQAIASSGRWPLAAVGATTLGLLLWLMFGIGGDPDGMIWFGEHVVPVVGVLYVLASLYRDWRSGALELYAAQPGPAAARLVGYRYLLCVCSALTSGVLALGAVALLLLMGGGPISGVITAVVAAVPSLLLLTALALWGFLLFRHPAGGLAVPLTFLLIEARLTMSGDPFFSPWGASASTSTDPLAVLWPLGKVTMLAATALLLFLSYRLLRRPLPLRVAVKACALSTLVALLTIVITGSATSVVYGYLRRDKLAGRLSSWYAQQMGFYRPLPVAYLYGPVFHAYLELPPVHGGDPSSTTARAEGLKRLLSAHPHSFWAETIAYELAGIRTEIDGAAAVGDAWTVAEKFPHSRLAPGLLARIVSNEQVTIQEKAPGNDGRIWTTHAAVPLWIRMSAAARLLERYPKSEKVGVAARLYDQYHPALVRPAQMIQAANAAAASGPAEERAHWLLRAANANLEIGRMDEAQRLARQALDDANRYPPVAAGPATRGRSPGQSSAMQPFEVPREDPRAQAQALLQSLSARMGGIR